MAKQSGIVLSEDEIKTEVRQNLPQWQLAGTTNETLSLKRVHTCPTYLESLELLYRIGKMAESENHHPDLLLHYRRLTILYWTHSAKGVTGLDIEQAKKVEALLEDLPAETETGSV